MIESSDDKCPAVLLGAESESRSKQDRWLRMGWDVVSGWVGGLWMDVMLVKLDDGFKV